jgi:DNA polymerase III delta prime subunit
MLKTQIMTMFMMRPSTGGHQDMVSILYGMLLMNIVEYIFKFLPGLAVFLQSWVNTKTPVRHGFNTLLDKKSEQMNSITMTRVFHEKSDSKDKTDNAFVEKVDAVLDFICNLDNAKHVRLETRYSLNTMDDIELTPMLRAKVKQITGGDEEQIVELLLFSTLLKVSEIRRWVDEIHENYMFEKNNKLGNKIFYFNEVPAEPLIQQEMMPDGTQKKSYRWENLPKMLSFHMNEFKTSKSFANVYGNHVDELKERLNLFIKHPDWYMERGIPHSLGIMLHGVPGSGKTSTIKAVARDTHRHIFNLSLRPYTTQRQLTSLFFNETVVVHSYDGAKLSYKIPLNRRVYVIEDIDCLTDVVLDRSIQRPVTQDTKEGESVTLSFLLNLLDGVLETPGRILIITTNFPDKLDKALVRPGRIDVKIEFKNAGCEFIMDMVNKFYTTYKTIDYVPTSLENVFTPAEVMESLCMFFKDPDAAIDHLLKKKSVKLTALEEAKGTLLERLEISSTSVLEYVEIEKEEEKDYKHSYNGLTWDCKTCKTRPGITCKLCREMMFKANPPNPPSMIAMNLDTTGWSMAEFSDAEFLDPSAAIPGAHPCAVRSTVDLNQ